MYISKQFYVGQYTTPRRAEILRRLQHGGPLPFIYALVRAAAKEGLINIYAVRDLRNEAVQCDNPLLTGITIRRKGVSRVAQTIITELYARNGTMNIDASFNASNA